MIDKATVVKVEIDKLDQTVLPETYEMKLKAYTRGLSRMNQVRLAVALDLASEKT